MKNTCSLIFKTLVVLLSFFFPPPRYSCRNTLSPAVATEATAAERAAMSWRPRVASACRSCMVLLAIVVIFAADNGAAKREFLHRVGFRLG